MPQDKKEEIIQKAVQLFLKKGYERASMRDLGKAVGIQAPGLYHYYKSKKDILNQINEDSWQKFNEMIFFEAKKVADPEERITFYIRNMIKYQFVLAEKTLIVDDSIPIKYLKTRKGEEREVFQFLRDTIHELSESKGIKSIDPTMAAFTLFSMVSRVYKWFKPQGKITLEELTDQMIQLFFHGLYGQRVLSEQEGD